MAVLYFLLIAWVLVGAGRSVASLLRLPVDAEILERNLIGYAIGLVLLAYGMLAIGLAGVLYPAAALGLIGVLALAGIAQWASMGREAVSILATCFHPQRLVLLMIAVLAFFGVVSMIGCFAPPIMGMQVLPWSPNSIYTEYDSIAYHLADPKIYIQAHRIYPIYWEHHSNFAFTGEMWYTLGLLFHSIPLAKLFHWSCGLAASLAIYRLGLRFLGQRTGVIAVIVFASTPLVFWEATTAYVDLVATFFTTLTLLALSIGMSTTARTDEEKKDRQGRLSHDKKGIADSPVTDTASTAERWVMISAVLMGLTLSSKATAVVTLALFAVGLLYWRLRVRRQAVGQAIGLVAVWCVVALIVGCPWYVKAIAYTGDPIYPFYFQLFGGKYWNLANAQAYDASNAYFGLGHQPVNLLLAPWNFVMYSMPGHPAVLHYSGNHNVALYPMLGHPPAGDDQWSFNNYQTEFATISPVLLAALFVPAFLRLRPTDEKATAFVGGLSAFALMSFAVWFETMQYCRYMLPFYPALCLLAAWVVDRALDMKATITGWILTALTACSVIFGGSLGAGLMQAQLPVATGRQTVDDYVSHGYGGYPAMQFINDQLPDGTKVVFYNNPLGFYCDKPYLWGEAGHSTFIPYNKMTSADDLLAYFHRTHVTHVLINVRGFDWPPSTHSTNYVQWLYELTAGRSAPVFEQRGYQVYALPGSN